MATPDPYPQQARKNFGPIAGEVTLSLTPSNLITGLTVARVINVFAKTTNTGFVLVSVGGAGPFRLEAGKSIEVDAMYEFGRVLVSSTVNGETLSYMSTFNIGE